LAIKPHNGFPGGSRQKISNAGNRVRQGTATNEDVAAIEEWRAAHRHVLNSFQAFFRNRTRDTEIVVAQRHKRRRTIIDKLSRFPKMQLGRMDDVAGCRLIFPNIEELYTFRNNVHSARFNHTLKNDPERYDYISNPKESGYRGIHDIYKYDVRSETGRNYKGLLIEIQYRTFSQHAWATCVELVGFLTNNQPKFDRGDERFKRILRISSEIIARSVEDNNSSLPGLSDATLLRNFLELDKSLGFMEMLRRLNATDKSASKDRNFILVFGDNSIDPLEIHSYPNATTALQELFNIERERPDLDVVLVKGDTAEDIREAFKNYFSDARHFIELIESGCEKLSGKSVLEIELRD